MTPEDRNRLSRLGDSSAEATARRIKAARKSIGMSQAKLAGAVGVTPATIGNIEQATAYPGRSTILYLHMAHQIDANFVMVGDAARLPAEVYDRVFAALAALAALDQ